MLEPALADLLALPLGQRADEHRVVAGGVRDVGREPALLGDLAEREAAPGRLE
jgi:hypothetical protein